MKKQLIVFLLLFPCFLIIKGQSNLWQNYTNGNRVNKIISESNFLWIATNGGLVKYDTTNGETIFFNKVNSGIPEINVTDIIIDNAGNKWLTLYGKGIAKFDNNNWTSYNSTNSAITNDYIESITNDQQGNIWIGTINGACKFDGTNWSVYNSSNSGLKHDEIKYIVFGRDSTMYFSYVYYNELSSYKDTTWHHYNSLNSPIPNSRVCSILPAEDSSIWVGFSNTGQFANFDGNNWDMHTINLPGYTTASISCFAIDNGKIWLGTNYGVVGFDTVYSCINTSNSQIISNSVFSIMPDEHNSLYVGTYNGLEKTNGSDFFKINTSNSIIPNSKIWAVEKDAYGNVWIGCDASSCVSRFSYGEWKNFGSEETNGCSIDAFTISANSKGEVWFGTPCGKPVLFNGSEWHQFTTSDPGCPDVDAYCIASNNVSTWFGGLLYGPVKYSGGIWKSFNSENLPVSNSWVSAIAMQKNLVWVGLNGNGIYSYNGAVWTDHSDEIPMTSVACITTDTAEGLWIANSSIMYYNGSEWITYSSANSGLPDGAMVFTIAVDKDNRKWIGTTKGLVVFNDTSWVVFNTDNSPLTHDWVRSICFDNNNTVWIGTENGLSAYNASGNFEYQPPQEMQSFLFPNPAHETVYLHLPTNITNGVLTITNSVGALVLQKQVTHLSGEIDISHLNPGIYIVQVRTSHISLSDKLIIE